MCTFVDLVVMASCSVTSTLPPSQTVCPTKMLRAESVPVTTPVRRISCHLKRADRRKQVRPNHLKPFQSQVYQRRYDNATMPQSMSECSACTLPESERTITIEGSTRKAKHAASPARCRVPTLSQR